MSHEYDPDDPSLSFFPDGRPAYYDRDGRPLLWREWVALHENEADYLARKRVAATDVGSTWVSTVWLGYDHNFMGHGPPLIFETMSFAPDNDSELWNRYPTEAAALAGHDQVVAELRDRARRP